MPEYTDLNVAATIINSFIAKYNHLQKAHPKSKITILDSAGNPISEIKKASSELIELVIQDESASLKKIRYIHPSQFDLTITID